ncbi:hypothetical protein [Streptomyces sp. TRM68367]|uniref:hypothetical protein n=1 Tax=Streptomyces sp. TRM68367 TaxID=2758415 RepID=UPI00165B8756|nr:hypothetical protein [Streptomyces sp. TRM68367]MBC9729265.1 hypothetical protein [Streptomyces sp. TRM68367]
MGTTAGIRPVTRRARVRRTTDYPIQFTGWPGSGVPFQEAQYDNGQFWDPALPGRFTIRKAGVYSIGAAIRWAGQPTAGGAGWRGLQIVHIRGATTTVIVSQTEMGVDGGLGVEQTVATEYEAQPGDLFAIRVAQTSNGPLALQAAMPVAFWISSLDQ